LFSIEKSSQSFALKFLPKALRALTTY